MATHELIVQEILVSLAELHDKVDSIDMTVEALAAEIGPGIPNATSRGNRETIRERLHSLDNDSHAVRHLADQLMKNLDELSNVVKEVEKDRHEARIIQAALAKRWSKWRTRLVFTFASVPALVVLEQIAERIFG